MDGPVHDRLVSIIQKLKGNLADLNGITATGADGMTFEEHAQLQAVADDLQASLTTLNGIADPPDQQGGGG